MRISIAKALGTLALVAVSASCSQRSEVSSPTEPSSSVVNISGPHTLTIAYLCKGSDLMGSLNEPVVVSQAGSAFFASLPRGGSFSGTLEGASGTASLIYTYPSNYPGVSPGHLSATGKIDAADKPYPKARFVSGSTDGCAFGYAEAFLVPK